MLFLLLELLVDDIQFMNLLCFFDFKLFNPYIELVRVGLLDELRLVLDVALEFEVLLLDVLDEFLHSLLNALRAAIVKALRWLFV